jgi:hypothetical protein
MFFKYWTISRPNQGAVLYPNWVETASIFYIRPEFDWQTLKYAKDTPRHYPRLPTRSESVFRSTLPVYTKLFPIYARSDPKVRRSARQLAGL